MNRRPLRCSVISSSSDRPLPELFDEVCRVSGVHLFDLMVLRDIDVRIYEGAWYGWDWHQQLLDHRSSTQLVADWDWKGVADWIAAQCRSGPAIKVAALATYFPDIASLSPEARRRAVRALANTVCIALRLAEPTRAVMDEAIIEIVCGNVLDPCPCAQCNYNRIFSSSRDKKYNLLIQSLSEAIGLVGEQRGGDQRFAIGLELEPGETYVLRDLDALGEIVRLIEADPKLRDYVGLNLDIAHMKIARIPAERLIPYRDRIVHAHIADHPGLHTHDQYVGAWSPIERPDSSYLPYVELLGERARTAGSGLPFSGAIALELEGNDRIRSIHRSLGAMAHLVSVVNGA